MERLFMMDSTDAFIQGTEAEVRAAYDATSRGRPLVMAVETNCPSSRCTTAPVPEEALQAAEATTGIRYLRYVNGGMVMGEAWALTKLWDFVSVYNNSCCSKKGLPSAQLGIGRFIKANPQMFAFDLKQRLCAVITNLKKNNWNESHAHYEGSPLSQPQRHGGLEVAQRLVNRHSRIAPCFIHVPGAKAKLRRRMPELVRRFEEIASLLAPSGVDRSFSRNVSVG